MTLSSQLRIVLLIVGIVIVGTIYWLGKRRAAPRSDSVSGVDSVIDDGHDNATATALERGLEPDDEMLDTPAYMRRQGLREVRRDYEPHIAEMDDYLGDDAVPPPASYIDIRVHETDALEPRRTDAVFVEPIYAEPQPRKTPSPEPEPMADQPVFAAQQEGASAPRMPVLSEPPPVMQQPSVITAATPASAPRALLEAPTLSQVVTPTVRPAASVTNRKIIALRLPMPRRVPGDELLRLFAQERLQHGKFSIFHRLHEGGTVFSVASMVEPGSFQPAQMAEQQFPGVSLFMLLPGPLDGLVAYDQMLSCAQRLAHATGGELHDERGNQLTPHHMERLREEVLDFQHLIGSTTVTH